MTIKVRGNWEDEKIWGPSNADKNEIVGGCGYAVSSVDRPPKALERRV